MLTTPLDWILFFACVIAVGAIIFLARRVFPQSRLLAFVLGLLGMVLMSCFALLGLDLAGPAKTGVAAYEAQRGRERQAKTDALRAKWEKQLTGTGWVDEEKKIAHIPIKRALELELVALKQRKPRAAGPVAVPPPPAPTPAPAEAPADAKTDAPSEETPAPAEGGEPASPEASAEATQPAAATPAAEPAQEDAP